jgi:hypothetical protein
VITSLTATINIEGIAAQVRSIWEPHELIEHANEEFVLLVNKVLMSHTMGDRACRGVDRLWKY